MMTLSVDVLSMPVLLPHDPFRMRRELDWLEYLLTGQQPTGWYCTLLLTSQQVWGGLP